MPTVPDIGSTTGVTPQPQGGEYDEYAQAQKPNATQVLLAAATMHNQGRLVTGDSHIGFGGAQPKFSSKQGPKGTRR